MPILDVEGFKIKVNESIKDATRNVVSVNEEELKVEILKDSTEDHHLLVRVVGRVLNIKIGESPDGIQFPVKLNGKSLNVSLQSEETTTDHRKRLAEAEGPLLVSAPMAGRIVSIRASVGARVSEGEALAVLEAMKMENEIAAPREGTVREVYARPGSLVKAGDKLVLIN